MGCWGCAGFSEEWRGEVNWKRVMGGSERSELEPIVGGVVVCIVFVCCNNGECCRHYKRDRPHKRPLHRIMFCVIF